VAYDTTSSLGSASVAPFVEWVTGSTYGLLGGNLTAFEGGQWASQARGDLSLLVRPAGPAGRVFGEVLGSAAGSLHSTGYRTAATRGELRLHLAGRTAGLWAGGTGATGWMSSSTGIATALGPTAGAWARHRAWSVSAHWAPLRFEGYWFPEVQGRLSTTVGPVDLMGYAGWRGAPSASGLSSSTWGGGTLALWFTRRVALVVGGGSYPADLIQALPRGRYVTAGIRLSAGRPSVWTTPSGLRAIYTQAPGEGELRFAVPGATRVELVADWTHWQPVPMERGQDGQWVLRVALPPGVYRFNLIVDGERWIVPEGVTAVDDGYGGKNCLLVVS
jgi:hypothetical protein